MAAHRALLVEDMAAEGRRRLEHRRQRLADRRCRDLRRRRREEAFERAGEADRRHCSTILTYWVDINIMGSCQITNLCRSRQPSECAIPAFASISNHPPPPCRAISTT